MVLSVKDDHPEDQWNNIYQKCLMHEKILFNEKIIKYFGRKEQIGPKKYKQMYWIFIIHYTFCWRQRL